MQLKQAAYTQNNDSDFLNTILIIYKISNKNIFKDKIYNDFMKMHISKLLHQQLNSKGFFGPMVMASFSKIEYPTKKFVRYFPLFRDTFLSKFFCSVICFNKIKFLSVKNFSTLTFID